MMLGVRAHDFGKLTVEELADRISEKGISYIQLALSKAVAGIDTGDGRLNPGMAYYIRDVFQRKNIQIAVLGCYINPVHPDRDTRKRLIGRFKEHIRYVRDFGCSIVATETGSVNADYSFNPENHSDASLKTLIESVGEFVEEAEKWGVIVGIEGVARHVVNTPEKMRYVLDTIKSNNLQIVLDPVNYLDENNYSRQDEVIKQSFELLGDNVVTIHAKDFIMDSGKIKSVEAGRGSLNYELLFRLVKERKPYVNILLENAKMPTIDESLDYVRNIY